MYSLFYCFTTVIYIFACTGTLFVVKTKKILLLTNFHRTATIVPRPPVDASLPKGTKVITRSRRVATTIVTPSRKTEVTNNIFLNAPTVTKGSPEGAATCWGDGNPAKFFSSNLEKRLIG